MSDICLVHMPFSQLGHPSMALSVLVTECRAKKLDAAVCYGNMRFAKEIGLREYDAFLQYNKLFMLVGECLFKSSVGYADGFTADDFFQQVNKDISSEKPLNKTWCDNLHKLYKLLEPKVEGYLESLADHILAGNPKVVGCDITYEQRNASLALLKILKQRKPDIITFLGGNNCTGKRGQILVNTFDFVDGVFSGEADHIFPQICERLLGGEDFKSVQKDYPSLLSPDSTIVNGSRSSMESCAFVDFDDYFQELKATGWDKHIQPCLLVEGSRGCWWGEKHPCTFCGIHPSFESRCYRAKSPERLYAELEYLQNRYGVSAFVFTDCILSYDHVNKLTDMLIDSEHKYYIFAETKSNLSQEQVKKLRQAGFILLQPGIEALQDDLLVLMNKGNRAIKHVELLKRGRQYGIGIIWNMLKEMPFDKADYYEETLALSKKLSHLQPPAHLSTILYQGNSIYNCNPEQFGLRLEPMELYRFVGADSEEFVLAIADVLDNKNFITDLAKQDVFQRLEKLIDDWIMEYRSGSHLSYSVGSDTIDIIDLRRSAKHLTYTLTGVEKRVYELTDGVITISELKSKITDYDAEAVESALEFLEAENLMIKIGNEVLGLAVSEERLPYINVPELPVGVTKA